MKLPKHRRMTFELQREALPWLAQVILMAGLQGVGKTTACGKLALALQKRKKRVLMVATDVYRPAAIDQLVKLGERIKVTALYYNCWLAGHGGSGLPSQQMERVLGGLL